MKKIIFAFLILGSVYSFAAQKTLRTVEKCRVTSRGIKKMVKDSQTVLAFSQEKHLILQDLLTRLIINSQKEQYLKCIFMEAGTEI